MGNGTLEQIQRSNRAQSQRIASNTATTTRNSAFLDRFDHLLRTSPPMTCPANPTVGANQWFRVYVPTKHTKLTMGQQDLESTNHDKDNGQRHHYTGFSVTTEGHVHVSAGKRTVIESRGPMIVQSTEASTYFGAPGDLLFGAEKGLHLGAPGGVLLHGGGGIGVDVPVPDDRNAGVPNAPDAANGVGALYSDIITQWNYFDTVVAGTIVLKGVIGAANNLFCSDHNFLAATVAAAGAYRDYVWAKGAFASAVDPSAMGGACINGTTGVICTTQIGIGYSSVFARNGFMVGSAISIFMAAQNAELAGILNASLESGRLISFDSGSHLEVLAKKKLQISSRKGGLHVDAKDVAVGGGKEGKQKPTGKLMVIGENVDLESTNRFHVGAKNAVAVTGAHIALKGNKKAVFAAKDDILMHAGTSHTVMNGTDLYLGVGKSIGSLPDYPTPQLGTPLADFEVIGNGLFQSFNPYRSYQKRLQKHLEKVKKFEGSWAQIHFEDGKVEFSINKFAVGCKGGDLDIGKKLKAKG